MTSVAVAQTYHVAQRHPHAGDDNPGSAEAPWKTISKAAETVRPGDAAILHAGVYREHVRPARSGDPGKPITYQAADGERRLALWGCPWRPKHKKYGDLKTWQRERGQDAHSRVADPRFAHPEAGDWRPAPDGPARALRAGPLKPPVQPLPAARR